MADWFDNLLNGAAKRIAAFINDDRSNAYTVLSNYYSGDQRPQLKTKVGRQDDNIIQNFTGLAVDRSVSRLFKGGVVWNLPDNAKAQQEYLDKVWDLNKKEILLYQLGLHGAVYGTPYVKISPDYLQDPYSKEYYPRLIPIDPEVIRITTEEQDKERVHEYRIEYKIVKEGKETAYREITRKSSELDYDPNYAQAVETNGTDDTPTDERVNKYWIVESWKKEGTAAWVLVDKVEWPYDFPPILHWKNLPSLKSVYGDSDIDDSINVQDKSNFVVSNTGKIIKHHASPKTMLIGVSAKDVEKVDSSPDAMFAIPREGAQAFNLTMDSDLASSRAFAQDLRQSIFDISREVDISSMADRLGQLTNFGLRVLWSDAIDKNDTKRQLYGDALKELNRRLLVLANFEGEESNPGEIGWGDPLPTNIKEELEADQIALDMGLIDLQSVAERYINRYGQDWETIVANKAEQQLANNANNNNVGALLLRNFTQGR